MGYRAIESRVPQSISGCQTYRSKMITTMARYNKYAERGADNKCVIASVSP